MFMIVGFFRSMVMLFLTIVLFALMTIYIEYELSNVRIMIMRMFFVVRMIMLTLVIDIDNS